MENMLKICRTNNTIHKSKLGQLNTWILLRKLDDWPDDDGEDDEDDGGVEVIQSIDPVIIVAALESGVGGKTSQDAVQPAE